MTFKHFNSISTPLLNKTIRVLFFTLLEQNRPSDCLYGGGEIMTYFLLYCNNEIKIVTEACLVELPRHDLSTFNCICLFHQRKYLKGSHHFYFHKFLAYQGFLSFPKGEMSHNFATPHKIPLHIYWKAKTSQYLTCRGRHHHKSYKSRPKYGTISKHSSEFHKNTNNSGKKHTD